MTSENTASVFVSCSIDDKDTVIMTLPTNVWKSCSALSDPNVPAKCFDFTKQTIAHFEQLATLLESLDSITKVRCRARMFDITTYLLKYVWTKESEAELYNLIALANHFGCEPIEYILNCFLQDRFKQQTYHLSDEQARKTFPSQTLPSTSCGSETSGAHAS